MESTWKRYHQLQINLIIPQKTPPIPPRCLNLTQLLPIFKWFLYSFQSDSVSVLFSFRPVYIVPSVILSLAHTKKKYIWNCTVHKKQCIVCSVPFNRVRTALVREWFPTQHAIIVSSLTLFSRRISCWSSYKRNMKIKCRPMLMQVVSIISSLYYLQHVHSWKV